MVYAVDRVTGPDDPHAVDEVAVTAFHLHSSTRLDDFLHQAFKRVSVRLVSKVMVDKQLIVTTPAVADSSLVVNMPTAD